MKNTLTAEEFRNAGYSPARAAALSSSTAHNWKAANGGERARLDLNSKLKTYEIYLVRQDGSTGRPRWTDAASEGVAIEACLRSIKAGALKRYTRRFASRRVIVKAMIAHPEPRHANGRPMILNSFDLTITEK